ncbi:NADPH-dependent FMN reductase [Chryseobacterium paridis]|uniref:NAD(P)H-dependent oxidoreductase n=1 Tax=Chryseobacterium paridis TaxID=2800328 RepID=A0ABS1FZQ8_9FLAO|nr:NAD(P)H-dependent oxidoreductase [Chryseobacterium paridis]MBK1897892.1 NAD(P)H-dependent oxidoreductase [Chryseobacterium paridis]
MSLRKSIVIIIGSATRNSSNGRLIQQAIEVNDNIDFKIYDDLSIFPHFNTELTDHNTPAEILNIREDIKTSAGVIFSTPEYIFSIPSGLKNILEWCVSTTVFSEKPTAVITAAANGEKGHEELLLILKTLGASVKDDHQLLIKGIKGKVDHDGIIESNTFVKVKNLILNFENSIS